MNANGELAPAEQEWLRAVRGEALAMAENAPPLERGQYVAWTIQGDFGYTESLSTKHMAYSDLVTLCGQIMFAKRRARPRGRAFGWREVA